MERQVVPPGQPAAGAKDTVPASGEDSVSSSSPRVTSPLVTVQVVVRPMSLALTGVGATCPVWVVGRTQTGPNSSQSTWSAQVASPTPFAGSQLEQVASTRTSGQPRSQAWSKNETGVASVMQLQTGSCPS